MKEPPDAAGGSISGEGEIRTPDTGLNPYDALAKRCLQPLGHLSSHFLPKRAVCYAANAAGPTSAGSPSIQTSHGVRWFSAMPHVT